MSDPDVLFVVLDSLRRDRVSAYGHDRVTTPNFDRLAARATLFEHAYTPAPWTLPSHCSMFTGRFPSEHGVTNGFADRSLRLPDRFETIAERLSRRGYRTAGFSNNPWVGRLSGLDRGFDTFIEWDLEISRGADAAVHRRRDRAYSRAHTLLGLAARQPFALVKRKFFTRALVERAERWFDSADGPTFAFLNLMEAHSPYYPPTHAFEELGLHAPNGLEARILNTKLLSYTAGKRTLDGTTRERLLEFYDASVRFQDAQLGNLLDELRRRSRFDDALVVICADHGKTLGEYDRSGAPPHYLRDVNTEVPLIVKRPGQRTGERRERAVELTGLFDLILGRADLPGPSPPADAALIEDWLPHTGRSTESVTRWRAVADGERKYVRDEDDGGYLLRGDGLEETLVATNEDGGELGRALDERVGRLALADRSTGESAGQLGRNVQGQLEDLGYL